MRTNAQIEHFTGSMCSAGRAMLRWTQEDLAVRAGVARRTISLFESGGREPTKRVTRDLLETFEAAGLMFSVDETAVTLKLVKKA